MTLSLSLRYCPCGVFGLYFGDNDLGFLELLPRKGGTSAQVYDQREIKDILKAAPAGIWSGYTIEVDPRHDRSPGQNNRETRGTGDS